jgi:penicillin amidase
MVRLSLICILFCSCSVISTYPEKKSQQERLSFFEEHPQIPTKRPVKLYWNQYSVPFVEAQTDQDLAFSIGMLHAYLRLGQLEFFRLVSQGRLSEVAGPIGRVKQLDRGLRLINFKKAAQNSIQKMSAESLEWMKQYTRGLNWYISRLKSRPVEHRLMDRDLEPYTLEEVITMTRLVSVDISWAIYLKYLPYLQKPDFDQLYQQIPRELEMGKASISDTLASDMNKLFQWWSKSGSNSLVISGKRSRSGAGLIASDPHVGLFLPSFWILMGIKSPSYHALGYMIPGLPAIALGRNQQIAWGGTNMRGLSSHLYDVSKLDPKQIQIRKETIKRRWWFDTEVEVRETPYGPILSDLSFFKEKNMEGDYALYWLGQQGSDEILSLLKANRAKNWKQFKTAFEDYRVSAMNMLYTDVKGNIGMVQAYAQPILKDPSETTKLVKLPTNPVVSMIKPTQHPNPYNPSAGFIASANNKPLQKPKIPMALAYSPSFRFERMEELAQKNQSMSVKDLMELQQDVYSSSAVALKKLITQKISQAIDKQAYQVFVQWDGRYNKESQGALVFHLSMYYLWQAYLEAQGNSDTSLLSSSRFWKKYLISWIPTLETQKFQVLFSDVMEKTQEKWSEHKTWGEFTRNLRAGPLGMIPVIGTRFQYREDPVDGDIDTLHKYGRAFNDQKGRVFYGASVRHITDMSSPDENYFVMNGGQDGSVLSENYADQIDLWNRGEYFKVPLSLSEVEKTFTTMQVELRPAS